MRRDTPAQIDALADVQRQRVQAIEPIDPRCFGNGVQRIRGKLRWQAGDLEDASDGGLDLGCRFVAIERLHESPEDAGITERAVAVAARQGMARDDRVEVMAPSIRAEAAR